MKKRYIIVVIALFIVSSLFAQSHTGIVATMTWEDGFQEIYLWKGTYHFSISVDISCSPFVPGNLWLWQADVNEINFHDSQYGGVQSQVIHWHEFWVSESFNITEPGWHPTRAGAYAIYGIQMHSNEAKLICTYVEPDYPDPTIPDPD